MDVESSKDSESDQHENIESYEKRGSVQFIPLDGELDGETYSVPSATTQRLLADKKNLGKSVKSSLNLSRPKFMHQTESSGQQPSRNEGSSPSKPGVRASRRASAEKREDHLVQTQQNTTQSTKKASTSIRSRMQADSPCKTSSAFIKKAQPYRSSTSQVQAQQSRSTRKPSISYPQEVWREKTKDQPSKPSATVQRTIEVNSSSKLSSVATERAHLQKDSSPQKVWRKTQKQPSEPSTSVQVNSSPKHPSMVTSKKTNLQEDCFPQKVWKKETKKQTAGREPNRSRGTSTTTPVYHITWDGFERKCESVAEYCPVCEKDLSSSLMGGEHVHYDDGYDYDFEPTILPDVSVLACGHAFHSKCFDCFLTEDQSSDPMCFLCPSKCS